MGPTNVALVKLMQADQALRAAIARYDDAARSVRLQERRINELTEKLKLAQSKLRESQTRAGQLDLEIKSREARIEKLRTQQQNAVNNKEYQAFLTEINTEKIDKGKIEDEAIKVMEQVEKLQAEVKELTALIDEEKKKHELTVAQLGGKLAELQADIDRLRPVRDAAAANVPPQPRSIFERIVDRNEGEALSAIVRPDPRREEYICNGCNMSLVVDVYNRLHSRDELVFCPSCHRILYIPEDLTPDVAINGVGGGRSRSASGDKPKRAPRKTAAKKKAAGAGQAAAPSSPWADLLRAAQGESVKNAIDADAPPVECDVTIAGKPMGVYKGKNRENLERVILFRMEEANLKAELVVTEIVKAPPVVSEPPAPAAEDPSALAAAPTAETVPAPDSTAQPAGEGAPGDGSSSTSGNP